MKGDMFSFFHSEIRKLISVYGSKTDLYLAFQHYAYMYKLSVGEYFLYPLSSSNLVFEVCREFTVSKL